MEILDTAGITTHILMRSQDISMIQVNIGTSCRIYESAKRTL